MYPCVAHGVYVVKLLLQWQIMQCRYRFIFITLKCYQVTYICSLSLTQGEEPGFRLWPSHQHWPLQPSLWLIMSGVPPENLYLQKVTGDSDVAGLSSWLTDSLYLEVQSLRRSAFSTHVREQKGANDERKYGFPDWEDQHTRLLTEEVIDPTYKT